MGLVQWLELEAGTESEWKLFVGLVETWAQTDNAEWTGLDNQLWAKFGFSAFLSAECLWGLCSVSRFI